MEPWPGNPVGDGFPVPLHSSPVTDSPHPVGKNPLLGAFFPFFVDIFTSPRGIDKYNE